MKLKSVELYGFKSFADKSKLVFEKDVAAIVGPNGSGKSNISDAVRWVLGEQSAKSLRGANMQDVIFSGTDIKNQMNMASVSLTLDNRDKALNLDFDEVNITRKVFRTGDSEYLLNKSPVRLKDIKELFLDTGIGKDGYSIIGQGRIDDILSGKSEDRRYIFEEASGIAKFKYKKNEAEKKLSKNEDSLSSLKSELKVKEQEVALLETQANNAKEGVRLTNELEKLELSMLSSNLDKIKSDVEKYTAEKELADKDLKDSNERLAFLNERILPVENEIEELEIFIEKTKEEAIRKDKNISKAKADISLYTEQNKFLKADIDRIEKDVKTRDDKYSTNNKKVDEFKNRLDKLKINRKELDSEILTFSKKHNELLDRKRELEYSLELKKNEADQIRNELSKLNIDKSTKENLDKANEIKKLEYKNHLDESIIKLKDYQDELRDKGIKLNNVSEQIEENSQVIMELVDDREKLQAQIKTMNEKIVELNNEYYKNKSERDVQFSLYTSYEGYYKPIQKLLKARDKDSAIANRIYGVLADLIEVEKEYKQAVDVTLGAALQNIVVEDENDGKFLIDYIKKNNLGRITFLPISKIKASDNDIKHPLVIDTLNNLIKYDNKISGIINHFLARTALVKDMNDAIQVSKDLRSMRIVTIDGDIINSWGSMVGGNFYKKESNSLLNRKATIKALDKKLETIVTDGKILRKEIEASDKDLRDLLNQLNNLDLDNSALLNEKNNLLADKKELNFKVDYEKKAIKNYEESISNMDNQFDAEDFTSIDSLENKLKVTLDEIQKKELDYKDTISSLQDIEKSNIKSETQFEVIVRDIKVLEDNIEDLLFENDEILKLNKIEDDNRIRLNKDFMENDEKITSLNSMLEKAQLNTNDDKDVLEKSQAKLSKLEENIKSDRFEIEKLKESINDLDKNIFQLEMKLNNLTEKREELFKTHAENYDVDEDVVLTKLKNVEIVKTTRKEILDVKNKLSKIGFFNFATIEQYNIEAENLEFLRKQYDDLVATRDDIVKLIKKLEIDMTRMFKESFAKINDKFGYVFNILFDGGEAQLILDGDDVLTAGIDIIAKPPGKKLKNLGLLSGGEKALTAVALLFAIFEINPAPFCILDEIDAALDEANIKRYINYLKGMTDRTQFIIITHRKVSMEMADILYGVTMEEKGISKVITLELEEYKEA